MDSLFPALLWSAIAFLIPLFFLGVMMALSNPFVGRSDALLNDYTD